MSHEVLTLNYLWSSLEVSMSWRCSALVKSSPSADATVSLHVLYCLSTLYNIEGHEGGDFHLLSTFGKHKCVYFTFSQFPIE